MPMEREASAERRLRQGSDSVRALAPAHDDARKNAESRDGFASGQDGAGLTVHVDVVCRARRTLLRDPQHTFSNSA